MSSSIPTKSNSGAPPSYSVQDIAKTQGFVQPQVQNQPQPHGMPKGIHPSQGQLPPQGPVQLQGILGQTFQPVVDVTSFSESTLITCTHCQITAMSRIEKKSSCCQITTGVIMICFSALIIPGITVLIFCKDTHHHCLRCNYLLGVKKGMCC